MVNINCAVAIALLSLRELGNLYLSALVVTERSPRGPPPPSVSFAVVVLLTSHGVLLLHAAAAVVIGVGCFPSRRLCRTRRNPPRDHCAPRAMK